MRNKFRHVTHLQTTTGAALYEVVGGVVFSEAQVEAPESGPLIEAPELLIKKIDGAGRGKGQGVAPVVSVQSMTNKFSVNVSRPLMDSAVIIHSSALKTDRLQWFEILAHLHFNLVESFPLNIMEPRRPLFQEIFLSI